MRVCLAVFSLFLAFPAAADTVVAARLIRAMSVIGPDDLTLAPGDAPGSAADPAALIGLETRVMLYPGRPILAEQVGAPTLIERNEVVALIYAAGGLMIETEARALDRGGEGDSVRVMNLASKKTVTGRVRADGSVAVGQE